MYTKAERRAARDRVAAYHEACLTDLLAHVTQAADEFRAGHIDAYHVDDLIHQYHRASQELWKFCWVGGSGAHIELTDHLIQQLQRESRAEDWWERGRPRRR